MRFRIDLNNLHFHPAQDWLYFPTENNSMIAAVIHLSDSTEKMGRFRVIPESHKLGKIENSDGHSRVPEIHDNYTLDSAKPVEAKRGDVLFFHCCHVHKQRHGQRQMYGLQLLHSDLLSSNVAGHH